MKHIIPISGKDSLATAIVQKDLNPSLEYQYIFNPVGFELPETLDWLKDAENYLGSEIIFIGKNLTDTEEWQNGFRPSINARWCTRLGKLQPTEDAFSGDGYIYYGLRADESERVGRIASSKSDLKSVFPLRTVGIDLDGVLKIVSDAGVMPPLFHWNILEKEFKRRLGEDFLFNRLTSWQRVMLFAWRTRNNCWNCFNMRRYEWVGLHDFHPDLFWQQVDWEEEQDTREKVFYTIKDLPLRELIKNRDEILDRHISSTVKMLRKAQQMDLFNFDDLFSDLLTLTSCGLTCGK
jgi:3'-phosphoadenosine 5'-phosphosulfate sulfotransferase (PAPS reductase)/FAD synthetase